MARTSDEWEKIIKEAYASDLPLKRWCLEHDIKEITFRKRLGKGSFKKGNYDLWKKKSCYP